VATEPQGCPLLERLTPEQERLLPVVREEWLRVGLSTQPADRARAEHGVRLAYQAAGLEPPRTAIWLDSPLTGAVAWIMLEPVEEDLWEPVRAHVRAQVGEQVWGEVRAQVHAQGGEPVWAHAGRRPSWVVDDELNLVWNQLDDLVVARVSEQVYDQVHDQAGVWWEVWDLVWGQITAKLGQQLRIEWSGLYEVLNQMGWGVEFGQEFDAGGGQRDAAWLSYFDYLARAAPEVASTAPLQGIMLAARSAGAWWPCGDVVVLTGRPTVLRRDEQGRLHHPHGPALAYPDGWGVWAWHGVRVPRDLIEHPEGLTVQRIRDQPNAEHRRVMLERYGHQRYLRDVGAERVHADQAGTLWRCPLAGDEPLVMVEVRNATPEPDGTRKPYWLRVPPMMRTAREAVAWTFNLNQDDYAPTVET
jgi:hypothetical protein